MTALTSVICARACIADRWLNQRCSRSTVSVAPA